MDSNFQVGETKNFVRPRRNWWFLYKQHAMSEGQGGIFCPPCMLQEQLSAQTPTRREAVFPRLKGNDWCRLHCRPCRRKLASAAFAWGRSTWFCFSWPQPSPARNLVIYSSCQHRGSLLLWKLKMLLSFLCLFLLAQKMKCFILRSDPVFTCLMISDIV